MPELPAIDPRTPELIADDLAARARGAVPDWRPPPEGDVGTVLYQVFAQFVGRLVERINRVPQHAFRTFLDVAGIGPLPPLPAEVSVAFMLSPNAGPTTMSAGTVVLAPATAERPEVAFETQTDLLVQPVALAAVWVADPFGDAFTDLLAEGTQPNGMPAFTGLHPVERSLRVTPRAGATFAGPCEVTVGITCELPEQYVAALLSMLDNARVAVLTAGAWGNVEAQLSTSTSSTVVEAAWTFTGVTPDEIDLALAGSLNNYDDVPANLSLLTDASTTVRQPPRLADAIAVDGALVDAGLAFSAFGELPRIGSQLGLSSAALAVAGAQITVAVEIGGGTSHGAELSWEYHDGVGWVQLEVNDGTAEFTASGDVVLTSPGVPEARVAGAAGHWLRARLTAGGYGDPVSYVPIDSAHPEKGLKAVGGTLNPPRIVSLTVAAMVTGNSAVRRRTGHLEVDGLGRPPFPRLSELEAPHCEVGQCLYLGLDGDPGNAPVSFHLETSERPRPPRGGPGDVGDSSGLVWEYLGPAGWGQVTAADDTADLTRAGVVTLTPPADMAVLARFGGPPLRWLRARMRSEVTVESSPRLVLAAINATRAVAGRRAEWEPLGRATGTPGQQVTLAGNPVLPGQTVLVQEPDLSAADRKDADETLIGRLDPLTGAATQWSVWEEVTTLAISTAADRHYTLQRLSGQVAFGDGIHGMIPPRGAAIAATYRYGGGAASNVGAGTITQMGSGLPQVSSVANPGAADGGADTETLEMRDARGPAALRHRQRAVTAGDMSWLAREVAGARVARCLVPPDSRPGHPLLVLVPRDPSPAPMPSAALLARVERELNARGSVDLAAEPPLLRVTGPAYRRVRANVVIEPVSPEVTRSAKADVMDALDLFFDARVGGADHQGWPLGRFVYESEVAQVLVGLARVRNVTSLSLSCDAVSQRLSLRAKVVPPLGLPKGASVACAAKGLVFTLDEPLPAGAAISSLAVRGPSDGDMLRLLADAVPDEVLREGDTHAVLVFQGGPGHPDVHTPLPRGSLVADSGGLHIGITEAPLRSGEAGSETRLRVRLRPGADPSVLDPSVFGPKIMIVHPAVLQVQLAHGPAVTVDAAAGATGTVMVRAEGLDRLEKGDHLGIPGHDLRIRVAADLQGADVPTAVPVVTEAWAVGDLVTLGADGAEANVVAAEGEVVDVSDVTDVVYLDPGSLVSPGTHVVEIASP